MNALTPDTLVTVDPSHVFNVGHYERMVLRREAYERRLGLTHADTLAKRCMYHGGRKAKSARRRLRERGLAAIVLNAYVTETGQWTRRVLAVQR